MRQGVGYLEEERRWEDEKDDLLCSLYSQSLNCVPGPHRCVRSALRGRCFGTERDRARVASLAHRLCFPISVAGYLFSLWDVLRSMRSWGRRCGTRGIGCRLGWSRGLDDVVDLLSPVPWVESLHGFLLALRTKIAGFGSSGAAITLAHSGRARLAFRPGSPLT